MRHIFLAEVLRAEATGMAVGTPEGTVIEYARGHFVPKGMVATSVAVVKNHEVRHVLREPHTNYYDIDPNSGEPVARTSPSPLSLDDAVLVEVASVVDRLQLDRSACVEFGIQADGTVFVIDVQEEDGGGLTGAVGGCVSVGEAVGRLCYLGEVSLDDEGHLHSAASQWRPGDGEPVVVWAARPQLGLVRELVRLADEGKGVVGVIFERFSPLAHFSLLLREWGLPAVAVPGFRDRNILEGAMVRIVAGQDESYVVEASETSRSR